MPPSPKVHAQVAMLPVDASENWTLSGPTPDVGVPVKSATGVVGHGPPVQPWKYVRVGMSAARTTIPDVTSVICLVEVPLLIVAVAALLMNAVPIDAAPKLSVLSGATRR